MAVGAKPDQRSDEDWQAIADAHALANALVIQSDSARLKRAQAWAKALVAEEKEEFESMKAVAEGNA